MLISKYIKKFGLVLVGVCSLMLAGCGLGSDKLSSKRIINRCIEKTMDL